MAEGTAARRVEAIRARVESGESVPVCRGYQSRWHPGGGRVLVHDRDFAAPGGVTLRVTRADHEAEAWGFVLDRGRVEKFSMPAASPEAGTYPITDERIREFLAAQASPRLRLAALVMERAVPWVPSEGPRRWPRPRDALGQWPGVAAVLAILALAALLRLAAH